jgi:hypothetical protein
VVKKKMAAMRVFPGGIQSGSLGCQLSGAKWPAGLDGSYAGVNSMSPVGRVQPNCGSDSSPETCHSWALRGKNSECAVKNGLWPSAEFPGGGRKLTLAGGAIESRVGFLARPRVHTVVF